MAEGRVKEGSLRRRRGGRRKENGRIPIRWRRGSMESDCWVVVPDIVKLTVVDL